MDILPGAHAMTDPRQKLDYFGPDFNAPRHVLDRERSEGSRKLKTRLIAVVLLVAFVAIVVALLIVRVEPQMRLLPDGAGTRTDVK